MEEFNKDLDEIKTKLNEIKLSEDFKENLKFQMENELNKSKNKEKSKTAFFPRKLVATFACFFLLISSCVAFGDEIESLVFQIFSNTDKKVEQAIKNGNYKKIDMEYVEHDGIGIKVDYVVQEEDALYIAFDVKSEERLKDIYFNNIEIINIENELIYKLESGVNLCIGKTKSYKKYNNQGVNIVLQIDETINNTDIKNIKIGNIECFYDSYDKIFNEIWEINI